MSKEKKYELNKEDLEEQTFIQMFGLLKLFGMITEDEIKEAVRKGKKKKDE